VPRLHLLRGELNILKANNTQDEEKQKDIFGLSEADFQRLLSQESWELLAYKALVKVYASSGEQEKFEDIIDILVQDQSLLLNIIQLLSKEDVESAIVLTERLQSRFPGDRSLKELIKSLRSISVRD
jgi:hypothetical protein